MFHNIPGTALSDIALYTGECTLIEVASWAIPYEYRQLVRLVAFCSNSPKKTSIPHNIDFQTIEKLLELPVGRSHWFYSCRAITSRYVKSLRFKVPNIEKIDKLLNANILDAVYFFSCRELLVDLCCDPEMVAYYCRNVTKHREKVAQRIKKMDVLIVRDIAILNAIFDAPDNDCSFYALNAVDSISMFGEAYDIDEDIQDAFNELVTALFMRGEFKYLADLYLISMNSDIEYIDDFDPLQHDLTYLSDAIDNCGINELKLNEPKQDISCIIDILIKLEAENGVKINYSNYIKYLFCAPNSIDVLKRLLNDSPSAPSFYKLIMILLSAISAGQINWQKSIQIFELLLCLDCEDYKIGKLLDNIYYLPKDHPFTNMFCYWIARKCKSEHNMALIAMLDRTHNILTFRNIVKSVQNATFKISNYDLHELKKYNLIDEQQYDAELYKRGLITQMEYVKRNLCRMDSSKFESYFAAWNLCPELHGELIWLVLKTSLKEWQVNSACCILSFINNTLPSCVVQQKALTIMKVPKFAQVLRPNDWFCALNYYKLNLENEFIPLPIDFISAAIQNAKTLDELDIEAYMAADINLLFGILYWHSKNNYKMLMAIKCVPAKFASGIAIKMLFEQDLPVTNSLQYKIAALACKRYYPLFECNLSKQYRAAIKSFISYLNLPSLNI